MADFIAGQELPQYKNLPHTLRDCGNYLLFRDYYTIGKVRLAAACFCKKHLLCPLCAVRRGAKLLKAYHEKFQALLLKNPNLKPYLVTLTVKNGPDLQERYLHLNSAVKRYVQARRNAFKKNRPFVEMAKASAAVWSFEFKRGKNSGEWHPHTHGVWLCEDPPDQAKIAEEWKRLTGDSYIVDVTPFFEGGDPVKAFAEVFKYALKFSDLPLEDNLHGYQVLSGRRMVASIGDFRGIEIPEELTDEIPEEDLPYVEILFKYSQGKGYELATTERFTSNEDYSRNDRGNSRAI